MAREELRIGRPVRVLRGSLAGQVFRIVDWFTWGTEAPQVAVGRGGRINCYYEPRDLQPATEEDLLYQQALDELKS